MQFSEGEAPWREIPGWVYFLLNLGYQWPDQEATTRRVGFVSMPCDSAAAGLIALGALRKRLESGEANDFDAHFKRILGLGDQHPSNPVLVNKSERGRWVFDGRHTHGGIWVKRVDPVSPDRRSGLSIRRTISFEQAKDWFFQEEPPISESEAHYQAHYENLLNGAGPIHLSNLTRSDLAGGVCLIGRVAGECATLNLMNDVCFRADDQNANLAELLTIDGWSSHGSSPNPVPRVSFVNSRRLSSDPITPKAKVSIVDGDLALLRVLARPEFDECDIVCAYPRSMARERLEELGAKIEHLSQWYSVDHESLSVLPRNPRGIAMSMIRKRCP